MHHAVHCVGLGGALGVLLGPWICPLSTPWGRNPRTKCAPRPPHGDTHYAMSRLEQNRRARTPERAVEAYLRTMDEHVRARSRRDEAEPTSTLVVHVMSVLTYMAGACVRQHEGSTRVAETQGSTRVAESPSAVSIRICIRICATMTRRMLGAPLLLIEDLDRAALLVELRV